MARPLVAADNERAVNQTPLIDSRAVSRLLNQSARMPALAEARPRPRERLEALVGGELAHRLVGALAGDHRVPPRLFVD
jgi:hypothetical protein